MKGLTGLRLLLSICLAVFYYSFFVILLRPYCFLCNLRCWCFYLLFRIYYFYVFLNLQNVMNALIGKKTCRLSRCLKKTLKTLHVYEFLKWKPLMWSFLTNGDFDASHAWKLFEKKFNPNIVFYLGKFILFVFQKIYFKVKILNTFETFTDFHIKNMPISQTESYFENP